MQGSKQVILPKKTEFLQYYSLKHLFTIKQQFFCKFDMTVAPVS